MHFTLEYQVGEDLFLRISFNAYVGETFGDVTCLAGVEKTDLMKIPSDTSPSSNYGNYFLSKRRTKEKYSFRFY